MICHHYKCIFVHIPKNAGQSIEHVFLDLLGLTWETRAPLLLRHNDRPEIGPPSLAHLTAREYVEYKYVTQDMFNEYFKFAFVRNPWSRMVSMYKYIGYNEKCEFKEFLLEDFRNRILEEDYWFVRPQSDFIYSEEKNLLVDYVGRFEDLQNGFNYVCNRLGVRPSHLPHVNSYKRSPSERILGKNPRKVIKNLLRVYKTRKIANYKSYQKYYDQESIEFVAEIYKNDIELLGYDFE